MSSLLENSPMNLRCQYTTFDIPPVIIEIQRDSNA